MTSAQFRDDEVLGAQDVAELLDMNVQMVRKYAREGRLPAYRLPGGRNYKFFRRELIQYLRQHPVDDRGIVRETSG